MMETYPKVLIINSNGFNDYMGGGITLKNLFFGWPLDKIALAHWDNSEPMESVCLNYYRFGYDDHHYIFPLNYISNEPKNGLSGHYTNEILAPVTQNKIDKKREEPHRPKFYKRIFLQSIDKSGLNEYLHPLRLTKSFKKWVMEFSPDIIYCQSGDIAFTNIVLKVQKLTKAKIVVHIMDDWPSTVYKGTIFSGFLRTIIRQKFVKLLRLSSLRLGISDAMAKEFERRYHQPFKYFHNPVNSNQFNITKTKRSTEPYLIVYSGRIGIASNYSIIEFAKVVQELRKDGHNISLNIYTDLSCLDLVPSMYNLDGTYLLHALKDKDYADKITEADLLLYPVDFDEKSIEYIRLSFPTKLPSYLSSGVPIFCYGPRQVHSIEFMIDKNLGFSCTQQNPVVLKSELLKALNDLETRTRLSEHAKHYAQTHFERTEVRDAFHHELNNLS